MSHSSLMAASCAHSRNRVAAHSLGASFAERPNRDQSHRDHRMSKNSARPVGRHFLHIPGPSPLPDRILRAMDTPIIDHRGPEFQRLTKHVLEGIKTIFKTTN